MKTTLVLLLLWAATASAQTPSPPSSPNDLHGGATAPALSPPTVPVSAQPTPADTPRPQAFAGPTGFGMGTTDGSFKLIFHWALLSDFQNFFGPVPPGVTVRDTFAVRFAGMQMDAILFERVHSQVFVDFSQGKATLYDAWVEGLLLPELKIRAGKFLFPISEERLTPGIALPFVSTSFATVLLPSRDTGLQVYGTSRRCRTSCQSAPSASSRAGSARCCSSRGSGAST